MIKTKRTRKAGAGRKPIWGERMHGMLSMRVPAEDLSELKQIIIWFLTKKYKR